MHPPSTDPFYPGYHARSAEEVEEEYEEWTDQQQAEAEQARVQDSLRAVQDSLFRSHMNRNSPRDPHVWNQYHFYGDFYSDSYRFHPYRSWYSDWYRPYRYSRWHDPYRHHWRRPYRSWFSFQYSSAPWYINTWWADDYMWDRYFWYDHYYYDPFYSGSQFFYSGYYGGYSSPYYDYWYWDDSRRNVVDRRSSPQVQRPRDRDRFTRGVNPNQGKSSQVQQSSPSREDIRQRMRRSSTNQITPAVIDRENLRYRDIDRRSTYNRIQERTVPRSKNSDRKEARPAQRHSTRQRQSGSDFHKSTSRSKNTSNSRSYNSSGSSESSSGNSSGKSQRPRNRNQKRD